MSVKCIRGIRDIRDVRYIRDMRDMRDMKRVKKTESPVKMEKSGIEPEIAICKIDVLPIKLYPLPVGYISFNVMRSHIIQYYIRYM